MDLFSSDSDSDLELFDLLSDSSDSDSDSDDADPSETIQRIHTSHVLGDAEFLFIFRMNKATVQNLLNEIMPFIKVKSSRNHGIQPSHQLLLALQYYASGTMLQSVAEFAGVSVATASRTVADISAAIARLYKRYVSLHSRTVEKFYKIAQFPRVCGVIDCTHVPIKPSLTIGEQFINKNGNFSINVQVVCDADLTFMNVVARWPGSADDSTVFDNSVLKAQCDKGILGDHWLLGDSAYPNKTYLLTPLSHRTTRPEIRYNEAHKSTRSTVERTIRDWKRRFPVLSSTMRLSLPNIQAVIIATAVLHNICTNNNVEVPPAVDFVEEDTTPDAVDDDDDGGTRRDVILKYFR